MQAISAHYSHAVRPHALNAYCQQGVGSALTTRTQCVPHALNAYHALLLPTGRRFCAHYSHAVRPQCAQHVSCAQRVLRKNSVGSAQGVTTALNSDILRFVAVLFVYCPTHRYSREYGE